MTSSRMLLAALALVVAQAVGGQSFPSRPVTLTVGFAPGGGTDTAARIVAQKLSENLGQSVVVDDKAGAGGNVAAQHIAMAPPDGHTIHLTSVGPMTVAPHLVKDLAYDPQRDIAPITMGVVFPNVMVVHTGVRPTVAESGYPGFEATNWYAFVAPGKTPRELLDFWNRELTKVLNDPQVRAELAQHGLDPAPGTREELAQYFERESRQWGKVVREAKITAD